MRSGVLLLQHKYKTMQYSVYKLSLYQPRANSTMQWRWKWWPNSSWATVPDWWHTLCSGCFLPTPAEFKYVHMPIYRYLHTNKSVCYPASQHMTFPLLSLTNRWSRHLHITSTLSKQLLWMCSSELLLQHKHKTMRCSVYKLPLYQPRAISTMQWRWKWWPNSSWATVPDWWHTLCSGCFLPTPAEFKYVHMPIFRYHM